MEIIWTDFAISNLKIIYDYYLEKANRKAANKIRDNIFKTTKQLNSQNRDKLNYILKA